MIYSLGCDIAIEEHAICLLRYELDQQKWEVVSHKSFKNNASGSKALLRWLQNKAGGSTDIRCTMEATGIYYEQLALFLAEHAPKIHLSVVLPSKAKHYIASRGLRNKTDKVDAFGLALMGAERKLKPWQGIDKYWRKLRQLTRTRTSLLRQVNELRNQLHAQQHSGLPVKEVQKSLARILKHLEKECEHLLQQIKGHLASREDLAYQIQCLRSIPGIGDKTIAVILAETLGFTHFSSYGQLMSFSGYDVVANESGKRIGKRSISKKGSPYIRHAMYMPASTIVRRKPPQIYRVYERLVNKHSIKMKAHVAIQKKLLGYMYTLWKKQQMYDPAIIDQRKAAFEQQYAQNMEQKIKVVSLKSETTVDTENAVANSVL